MNKMMKRMTSFALTLLMIVSLVAGIGTMDVKAAQGDTKITSMNVTVDWSKIPTLTVGEAFPEIPQDNAPITVSGIGVDETSAFAAFAVKLTQAHIDANYVSVDEYNTMAVYDYWTPVAALELRGYKVNATDTYALGGSCDAKSGYTFADTRGVDVLSIVHSNVTPEVALSDGSGSSMVLFLSLGTAADITEEKKPEQAAPTGLTEGAGKINGTTTAMEYSADNGTTWTTCTDGSTAVAAGTYLVRLKSTVTNKASNPITVTVTKGADAGNGNTNVTTTVNASDVSVPSVSGLDAIYNTVVTDSNKGITAEDMAVVAAGGSVNIALNAKATTTETTGSKAITEKLTKDGYKKGMALDLSVIKELVTAAGVKTEERLIELPSLIAVTVDIPAELQGKASYVVYRDHEGTIDVLSTTPNADGEYIEVSADGKQCTLHIKKFSEYVLGYTEAVNVPKTGDNAMPMVFLAIAGLAGMGLICTRRKVQR